MVKNVIMLCQIDYSTILMEISVMQARLALQNMHANFYKRKNKWR